MTTFFSFQIYLPLLLGINTCPSELDHFYSLKEFHLSKSRHQEFKVFPKTSKRKLGKVKMFL